MSTKNRATVFFRGLFRDNPVFTMALGISCSIFMTRDIRTALLTGCFTCITLVASCILVSALKRVIPRQVRIPCYMLLICGALTVIQYMLNAYFPVFESGLNKYFLPLAVSCLVIGRAEGYALSHSVVDSGIDALGVGIGFTLNLVVIALLRELLGSGTFLGKTVFPGAFRPVSLFAMAPGILFISGCICALVKKLTAEKESDDK